MVLKYCTQYVSKSGRPSSNHRTRKGQSSPLFPRRVVLKNVLTMRQLHPSSKVVLKILHARLKHYMNQELPDVQAGFRKERGTRDQIANICWIKEKAKEFQKNIYLCFSHYAKAFDCVDHHKLWKAFKEMRIQDHLNCLLRNLYAGQETAVRTLQEQLIDSRLRKGYDRTVCCHPVCLIYMLSTSS